MDDKVADETRQSVREAYAGVARAAEEGTSCGEAGGCCGVPQGPIGVFSTRLGYSEDEVQSVPEGADMGLGCGNPRAIASLKPGETVLDLGSGGGFDCFLAARKEHPFRDVRLIQFVTDLSFEARGGKMHGHQR